MSQLVYTYRRPVEQVKRGDYVVRRGDNVCAEVTDTPAGELVFIDGIHEQYAPGELVEVAARTTGGAVVVG